MHAPHHHFTGALCQSDRGVVEVAGEGPFKENKRIDCKACLKLLHKRAQYWNQLQAQGYTTPKPVARKRKPAKAERPLVGQRTLDGEVVTRCAGVKASGKHKGQPCDRLAELGTPYCAKHHKKGCEWRDGECTCNAEGAAA